jgi:ribosomal protein L11 methyltransferase
MTNQKTKAEKQTWMKLELSVSEDLLDSVANFMMEIGSHGVYEEVLVSSSADDDLPEWRGNNRLYAYLPLDSHWEGKLYRLDTYIDHLADLFPDFPRVTVQRDIIEDPDWEEQWKKYFKPLRVGLSIVIKPSWERYNPAGGDIIVEIDPGMAFGTGQHASTRLCIEAIEEVMRKDRTIPSWNVLDVGTGTGILGITCAKLGAAKVLCLDIDKKAVEIARENVRVNDVAACVDVRSRPVHVLNGSYDLIVANLTEKLLVKLKDTLEALLQERGYLIISGIITENREMVEKAFLGASLVRHDTRIEKEWISYVLRKEEAAG